MRRLLPFLLLCAPASAAAGTASVYYFDHDYRITSGLSGPVEQIIKSTPSLRLERVLTEITYTRGASFIIDNPGGLDLKELNSTTSYSLTGEAEVLEGLSSIVLPPRWLAGEFGPALQESMRPYAGIERRTAQLLEGTAPSGIKFRVLRAPWRADRALWEPTTKVVAMTHAGDRPADFISFAIPMGLNGLNRKMAEEASDKDSAVMLSLGAGGFLAGTVLQAGPGITFDYMEQAGTDIAAMDSDDLKNFWVWSSSGGIKLSSSAPEFICSNLSVSDPELARLIKPYALRRIGGATVAFISFIPTSAAGNLPGAPFKVWDPGDEKAPARLIEELRGEKGAKAVIAVSFLRSDELGWLITYRGIDALIGPKSWETDSYRRTRTELDDWDRELHYGPALTLFRDAGGAGSLRLEFGENGALSALETAPPPEDPREPLFYREQVWLKERIAQHFLGSGDALLPDLRGLSGGTAGYTVPSFFTLAASMARKTFGAEAAVVRIAPFSSGVLGDTPTAMVKAWLGQDEPLVLAQVPGFHLQALARKKAPKTSPGEDPNLVYAGREYYAISGIDDSGRIAGLPLSHGERYLTVMPASLAREKSFIKILKTPAGAPAGLHETVIGALEKMKQEAPSRQAWESGIWDAARNFTTPRPVWRLNLRNLSAQMTNTAISGDAGYSQVNESRLSAVSQTQMQGSGRLFSEYYSEKFRFDAGISADYGKTVLRPAGQPRLTTESVDQLVYSGELVYRLRRFNGRLGQLVIGPYASTDYDTEFSRGEGLPLRKVLRGSAGLKLFEGAAIQELYAGLTTEQIYTYTPARTKFAVETGFRMALPLPGTALTLNAYGNYRRFARSRFDTEADLKERLELNFKVSTRLYGEIMISPFLNYFRASGKKLPGSASNLTAGFALEYSRLFKLKR